MNREAAGTGAEVMVKDRAEPGGGRGGSGGPGGGLGPPIDAPDPLQKYQWWILGGLAGALLIGGVFVAMRQQSVARKLARQKAGAYDQSVEDEYEPAEVLASHAVRTSMGRPASALLDDRFIASRRSQIDSHRAADRPDPGAALTASETIYLTAADSAGNMVSFINSLFDADREFAA